MKNAGMAGAVALVGIGLITIGLSNFANRAEATPAATVNAGPEEPTIVWYGTHQGVGNSSGRQSAVLRAWDDGTIEARLYVVDDSCIPPFACSNWGVISSPNEVLNAGHDINFDSQVNPGDLL